MSITLSSPNTIQISNFNIQRVLDLINSCGTDKLEVVSPSGRELIEIVKYCNNKACDNPECMIHREYLYKRTHKVQIELMERNIRSPKAWVFTGWKLPYPIDRDFCRKKLKELYWILESKVGSVTTFSIHMEVKLHKDSWYLHFHVVSGGLKDYRFVLYLWGRWIKYQIAIKQENIVTYVSKYASKTPMFIDEQQRIEYLNYIYKTQTSRFYCGKAKHEKSGWYRYDTLEWEAYICLKRDNELNKGLFSEFVDDYENRKLKGWDAFQRFNDETKEGLSDFMGKIKKVSGTEFCFELGV